MTEATAGLFRASSQGEERIDVAPDEITVHAVVEMGVEAIEPDLTT